MFAKTKGFMLPKKNPKWNPLHLERKGILTPKPNLTPREGVRPQLPVRQEFQFSTPFLIDFGEEYREFYKKLSKAGRAERIPIKEQVCLDCALDFCFHKRAPGDSPTRHRGYTLATPSEMIVYMYVQYYVGLNRQVPDITLIFSGPKINHFFTEILPEILADKTVNPDFLEKSYEEMVSLLTYFEEQQHLAPTAAQQIRDDMWSLENIQRKFADNLQKAQAISYDPSWVDANTYIAPREYEKRMIKETNNPRYAISQFEYELAEGIRCNIASNMCRNGPQFIHHKHRILETCLLYASYTYSIGRVLVRTKGFFSQLDRHWPHVFQIWGGLDFFEKNTGFLFPQDTVEFVYDIVRTFLKKSCKGCNYRCLHKFVTPSM